MRLFVFFDLPTETAEDRRHYRLFRKLLIESGFIMMQESVYCKLLLNGTAHKTVAEAIRRDAPPKGLVQMLAVTENQFTKMEIVVGEWTSDVVDGPERLVEL